jgi:transcriptional regulator
MALYTPPHFAVDERARVARLLHDYPFATLVTPGSPEPAVSHLPLLFIPGCEPHGTLIGHVARANPQWECARGVDSIAIFHGPHAYVSPSWYAHPERMVPTWNYATVHAHGTLEIIDDAVETRRVIDALVQRFEHARAEPWQLRMAERQRDAMIGAIVAFRMRIKRLEGKFKLSQNRTPEDIAGVMRGLRADGHAEAVATADWMGEYALGEDEDEGRRG